MTATGNLKVLLSLRRHSIGDFGGPFRSAKRGRKFS
jgi:hypothetical protein